MRSLLRVSFSLEMKAFSANEVVACVVTPSQKAELESLEQQRGGVDRESAMLAEEVLPL